MGESGCKIHAVLERLSESIREKGVVEVEELLAACPQWTQRDVERIFSALTEQEVTVEGPEGPVLQAEELVIYLVVPRQGGVLTPDEERMYTGAIQEWREKSLLVALESKALEMAVLDVIRDVRFQRIHRVWDFMEDPRSGLKGESDESTALSRLETLLDGLQATWKRLEEVSILIGRLPQMDKRKRQNVRRRFDRLMNRRRGVLAEFPYKFRFYFFDLVGDHLREAARPDLSRNYALERFGATPEQAREIAERFFSAYKNVVNARDKLLLSNQALVAYIAKHYRDTPIPHEDLIGEGILGLLRAIERYDLSKDTRLSTYATWWIRHAITRALSQHGKLVKQPVHYRNLRQRYNRIKEELEFRTGKKPSRAEIAEAMGISMSEMNKLLLSFNNVIPMDQPLGDDEDGDDLHKIISGDEENDPENNVSRQELRSVIRELLEVLPLRQQEIIKMRYGLDGYEPHTLKEVGEKLGITRERVRQLQRKAEKKLFKEAKKRDIEWR